MPPDAVASLDVNVASTVDPGPVPTNVFCRIYPPPAARYGKRNAAKR